MATLVDEPVAVAGRVAEQRDDGPCLACFRGEGCERLLGARVWDVGRSLPTLVLLAVAVARDATAAEPLAVGLTDGLAEAVGGRVLGFGAADALASGAVEGTVVC